MKPTDDFKVFYEKFLRLTTISGHPLEEYKQNLHDHLPKTLQSETTYSMQNPTDSFDTFISFCHQQAKAMDMERQYVAAHNRQATGNNPSTSQKEKSERKTTNPSGSGTTGGHTNLSQEEREKRMKLGMYFQCGEQGHMSAQCPKKKGAAQGTTPTAAAATTDSTEKIVELKDSENK